MNYLRQFSARLTIIICILIVSIGGYSSIQNGYPSKYDQERSCAATMDFDKLILEKQCKNFGTEKPTDVDEFLCLGKELGYKGLIDDRYKQCIAKQLPYNWSLALSSFQDVLLGLIGFIIFSLGVRFIFTGKIKR